MWRLTGNRGRPVIAKVHHRVSDYLGNGGGPTTRHHGSVGWGWMLASGIVDLILAGIIFAGLPGTAAWSLGLLVGINMVFGGTAMIGMALAARNHSVGTT